MSDIIVDVPTESAPRIVTVAGGQTFELAKMWCINGRLVPTVRRDDATYFSLSKSWERNQLWNAIFVGRKYHTRSRPCNLAVDILNGISALRGKANRRIRKVSPDGSVGLSVVRLTVSARVADGATPEPYEVVVWNDTKQALIQATEENLAWIIRVRSFESGEHCGDDVDDDSALQTPSKTDPPDSLDSAYADASSHDVREVTPRPVPDEETSAIDKKSLPTGVDYAPSRDDFIVKTILRARQCFHVRAAAPDRIEELALQRARAIKYFSTGDIAVLEQLDSRKRKRLISSE